MKYSDGIASTKRQRCELCRCAGHSAQRCRVGIEERLCSTAVQSPGDSDARRALHSSGQIATGSSGILSRSARNAIRILTAVRGSLNDFRFSKCRRGIGRQVGCAVADIAGGCCDCCCRIHDRIDSPGANDGPKIHSLSNRGRSACLYLDGIRARHQCIGGNEFSRRINHTEGNIAGQRSELVWESTQFGHGDGIDEQVCATKNRAERREFALRPNDAKLTTDRFKGWSKALITGHRGRSKHGVSCSARNHGRSNVRVVIADGVRERWTGESRTQGNGLRNSQRPRHRHRCSGVHDRDIVNGACNVAVIHQLGEAGANPERIRRRIVGGIERADRGGLGKGEIASDRHGICETGNG